MLHVKGINCSFQFGPAGTELEISLLIISLTLTHVRALDVFMVKAAYDGIPYLDGDHIIRLWLVASNARSLSILV